MADKSTRIPQPGDPDFDWSQYNTYKKQAGDPVAEAKAFLAQDDPTVGPAPDNSDLAPDEYAHMSPARYATTALSGEWMGNRLTEGGHPYLGYASDIANYSRNPIGVGLSGLRRLINPDADESRVGGAIDTAFGVTGAAPGLLGKGWQALKGLRGGEAAAEGASALPEAWKPFVRPAEGAERASTEIPYASHQVAQNPNQVLEVARDVVNESGDPLEKVLRGRGGKTGQSKPSVDALMQLANSGPKPKVVAHTGYDARDILASPHSQQYGESEFLKHKEDAYKILGKQVDPQRALQESVDAAELSNLPNLDTGISHTLETQARQKRMKEFGDAFRQGRTFKPEF